MRRTMRWSPRLYSSHMCCIRLRRSSRPSTSFPCIPATYRNSGSPAGGAPQTNRFKFIYSKSLITHEAGRKEQFIFIIVFNWGKSLKFEVMIIHSCITLQLHIVVELVSWCKVHFIHLKGLFSFAVCRPLRCLVSIEKCSPQAYYYLIMFNDPNHIVVHVVKVFFYSYKLF